MSLSPSGIWFEELAGSPRIKINKEFVTATRVLRVAWADWQDMAYELIGFWRILGTAAAPQFFPPIGFPGLPNLIVDDLEVEPFDPESPNGTVYVDLGYFTNVYDAGAKLTVTYKTLQLDKDKDDQPDIPEGTTLSYNAELGAEMMTIPGRSFKWSDSGKKLPEDVTTGLLLPTGNYTLTWDRVPLPPWETIRALRGKVNSTKFLGADPETVLFLGAQISRRFQLLEEDGIFWQLGYKFAENVKDTASGSKGGWNHFYQQGSGWTKIVDSTSGKPPFSTGEFADLFEFGTGQS